MKKARVKIPAKINLTLDIEGAENGYHLLESLVASVDVYDIITVSARKEDVIRVFFRGLPVGVNGYGSNAYFAADAFRKEFSTGGADIIVERRIPAGAGLGGSSADIAGVLRAMAKLYDIKRDLSRMAANLGSDVPYMLQGGFAVMRGRGERLERVENVKRKFFVLIIAGGKSISTAESYKGYDKIGKLYPKNTSAAVTLLREDDVDNFFKVLKNDLYESSALIAPEITKTAERLKKYGAAVMSGSGSAVYGIYKTKKERDRAFNGLKEYYGARLIKARTL